MFIPGVCQKQEDFIWPLDRVIVYLKDSLVTSRGRVIFWTVTAFHTLTIWGSHQLTIYLVQLNTTKLKKKITQIKDLSGLFYCPASQEWQ